MLSGSKQNAYKLNFYVEGILCGCLFSFLSSCAGKPPIKDYVLANEAMVFAKKYQTSKHSNTFMYKGRQAFKKAMYFYDKREHKKAQEFFVMARRYFEKAEVKARLKLLDSGGEDFL